jgi:N-acetylmuramoyl-L-alanine amidase
MENESVLYSRLKPVLLLVILQPLLLLASNRIEKMEMGNDRVMIHFAKPIRKSGINSFTLEGRSSVRYVFDFADTVMASKNPASGLEYGGDLISIRSSQFRKRVARVVLESRKAYNIKSYKADSDTYVITLPAGSADSSRSIRRLFSSLSKKKRVEEVLQKPDRAVDYSREDVSGGDTAARSYIMKDREVIRPKGHYRIVVDPGHGGHDSGALGGTDRRAMEKDAVLQIALRLRRHLKNLGFDVLMTRSSDRFVKLGKRTRYANRKHGDVFVSIHANAVPKRKWNISHGVETYFLQVTRNERAKRVAARENSVVLNKKDRLSKNVILNAIYTGPKIVLSNKLAIDVQKQMLQHLRNRYKNVKDGGIRPAPFWVLVGAEMPAILVETGYITNPMERKRLFDPVYQDLMARGIAEGISRYLANRERELE